MKRLSTLFWLGLIFLSDVLQAVGLGTFFLILALLAGYAVAEFSISLPIVILATLLVLGVAMLFSSPALRNPGRGGEDEEGDGPAGAGKAMPISGGPPVLVGSAARVLPSEEDDHC